MRNVGYKETSRKKFGWLEIVQGSQCKIILKAYTGTIGEGNKLRWQPILLPR